MTDKFDMSDIDRIAALDASVAEREANLTPVPEYAWEKQARERAELEDRREFWHRQAMLHSGKEAHYRHALEAICEIYPHTSTSGDKMAELAHAALDREYKPLGRE